jgi:peptide/nickel transport system substrate-binding protein
LRFSSAIVLLLCLLAGTSAAAAGSAPVQLASSTPPVLYEGTTLAPVRVVADWLGAATIYDPATGKLDVSGLGHTVNMRIGVDSAWVDGQPVTLTVPPVVHHGSTLVPIRFLANAFGASVTYDATQRIVLLQISEREAALKVPPTSAATIAELRAGISDAKLKAATYSKGGTYTVGVFEEPKSNNIVNAMGTGATTWTNAFLLPQYSTLYGNTAPRFDYAPVLASGDPGPITQEGDLFTAVVPLRKDMHWSDGTRFTAADVVFTYMSILAVGPDQLSGYWEYAINKDLLVKVEALDDFTVKFYLTAKPGLAQWQYGLLQVVILPKHHWEPVFKQALESQDPVKTLYAFNDANPVTIGGFISGRWEKGAFFEIKRDPTSNSPYEAIFFHEQGLVIRNTKTGYSYQSENLAGSVVDTVNSGPFVDNVMYRVYLDQNAAYLALQKGEVDYVLNPSGMSKGILGMLEKHPDIAIVQNATNGFRFLGFNCDRYPMNIKAFRQAIATVTDRDWLAENVLQGVIEPIASVVPPGNGFWHNPDAKVWGAGMDEYARLEAAVKILKDAGFTWSKEPEVVPARGGYAVVEGEGLRGPDGRLIPQLTILSPTQGYDPLRYTFALHLEGWIRTLGINVRTRPSDFSLIVERQNTRDYDMIISGYSLGLYPSHLPAFFHSQSGANRSNYVNPTYDSVIEAFLAADEINAARQYAFAAQEILAEDVPYVVLYVNPLTEGYRRDRVRYQFTELLDGIQGSYGMPGSVYMLE